MSGGRARQPPLLPARSSTGDQSNHDTASGQAPGHDPRPPGGRPKRTLIESACSACRRRKSRCDGVRPACSRCQALRTECKYEAEEGESRWSALRRRNQILETERAEIRELMSFLQSRPEHEAQEIFAQIRRGGYDDSFTLLRELRQRDLQGQPPTGQYPTGPPSLQHQGSSSLSSVASVDQRLPPIQAMFEVSEGARMPPALAMPPAETAMMHGLEPSSAISQRSYSGGSASSTEYPHSAGL